ncbi:Queuine tRNA-ribosyltransferase [Lotmaria passim]
MDVQGPYLVIPTRRGAVPMLTPAQANAILEPAERIVATSVFDAVDFVRPCTESGMSMSDFCGLRGYATVLTLRSSFQGSHPSAASTDAGVAGDTEKGRVVVSVDKWREVVKATRPNIAVELHESAPLSEPLTKRRRVAATRCETWHVKTEALTDLGCTLVPSISAGRAHDAGFVDAVPRNENAFEFFYALRSLKLSSSGLSMCVAHSVSALVAAMVSSVTLIECPLPWVLAEKGVAVVFLLCDSDGDSAAGATPLLDLNDSAYTLDIRPVCASCTCFTCTRHNRAYLHHLLTVQEMNSDILLTIHNLSQVARLVRAYRNASHTERQALVRRVLSAF